MSIYRQQFNQCFAYDVYFTRGLFQPQNEVLAKVIGEDSRKLYVLIDDGVAKSYPNLQKEIKDWLAYHKDPIELAAVETVSGGEQIKNAPGIVDHIGKQCKDLGICRHSVIMAIGGGAVLDAVGYAASITHRGIRLIRVPTTVLSQNDSGVGVKNGVNKFGVKNFYGVFAPPGAVLNDFDFLSSLNDRIWVAGVAESFKVAIIKDKAFLDYLLANTEGLRKRHRKVEEKMVKETAILHLEHIGKGGDPFEHGSSRPLDFGHWSAHKLESLSNFDLLHGEAVAIGIALDLHYAAMKNFIKMSDARHITLAMLACGLPVYNELLHSHLDQVLEGLQEFQEHLGGELTIAMPDSLGQRQDVHEMDHDLIAKAINQISRYGLDAAERAIS